MERQRPSGLSKTDTLQIEQWKAYPLSRKKEFGWESESSGSNYPLVDFLGKSLKGQRAQRISREPELKKEFFNFLKRIYKSDDSYILYPALKYLLNAKDEGVRNFGLTTFIETFSFMEFSQYETYELLDKWSEGLEEGDHNPVNVARLGVKHHLIPILEVERYKTGGFHQLFSEFGIASAERYYGSALKYMLESLKFPDMPYVQGIVATGDHSGVLLADSNISNFVSDLNPIKYRKPRLTIPFRVIEAANHDELITLKETLRQRFGIRKVLAYLVIGHSDGKIIDLSKNPWHADEKLSINDVARLDVFGKKWNEHVNHPTVILDACSTGKSLARDISILLNARVFAQLVPSSIKEITVSRGGRPAILDVIYNDLSIVYDNGNIIKATIPE